MNSLLLSIQIFFMKTARLSCSHALIRYLISQKIMIDSEKKPLFPGAFAIYGHGNVACIGQAMEEFKNELPGYRGHHEQYMALTGIGYARAMRRKQIFVSTSSVGPGSTNRFKGIINCFTRLIKIFNLL